MAEEFLALPGGVGAYRRVRTTALPLLAPWANRLSGRAYRAGRIRVDLDGLDLYTDPNGLPIHGMLSAQASWEVSSVSASGRVARLRAGFEYAGGELLAAFPFPQAFGLAPAPPQAPACRAGRTRHPDRPQHPGTGRDRADRRPDLR